MSTPQLTAAMARAIYDYCYRGCYRSGLKLPAFTSDALCAIAEGRAVVVSAPLGVHPPPSWWPDDELVAECVKRGIITVAP